MAVNGGCCDREAQPPPPPNAPMISLDPSSAGVSPIVARLQRPQTDTKQVNLPIISSQHSPFQPSRDACSIGAQEIQWNSRGAFKTWPTKLPHLDSNLKQKPPLTNPPPSLHMYTPSFLRAQVGELLIPSTTGHHTLNTPVPQAG